MSLDRPGRRTAPSLEAPYAELRRCRLPHVAATGIALWAGADLETLGAIRTANLPQFSDELPTAGRVLQLPAGGGRLLRAQRAVARHYGSEALFCCFGKPLSLADLTYASMVACREADVVPVSSPHV